MRFLRMLPLFVSLATVPLAGQYTVGKIVFTNPGPYPEADLLLLAALKPGDSLSKAGLQAAAARLVDSGYFDDVQATVDGPLKAVQARFKLTPIAPAKLYPASYQNFVWLSAEELAAFPKTVPLLAFGIPEGGNQQTKVQTALEALLAARSIPAKVSHAMVEPTIGHPDRVVEFTVDTPSVRLHAAKLTGVSPAMVPAARTATSRAQGSEYNEGKAGTTTAEILLAPWLDAGFIDAHLEHFERKVAPDASATRVNVDVQAAVVAGEPYRVSAVTFAATPIVSDELFAKTLRLHPDDVASRRELLATLSTITRQYHSKGYMDAVVDAIPTRDAAGHQVSYAVTVVPGEQYRLRNLTINGLPAGVRPDFDHAFLLKAGDVYDELYVVTFLVRNNDITSLRPYTGIFTASADPDTHLLDLNINFTSGSSVTVH